jgi:adenylate kinase family enzyme
MVDAEIKDLKKALGGNVPKVIFVCGGPASGKGTQCARLVEEFGFTHVSLGDLMRAEAEKPTKEGERLKKTMADGGLVPTETSVAILVNGMIAKPSKSYLIDGFPRSTD